MIWIAFIIKHFICDFPLQSMRMVNQKGTYGKWGGIEHAAIHGIFTLVILSMFHLPVWLALVDFAIHYHIDWAKMKINAHYKLKPDNPWFWHLLGLDQMAHYLTYAGIIWVSGL